ncbi:hypothetical protein NPIL_576731 [Nephila pilipes]|uniref:RNA-directed DNA polymerase n=1 Tax=Nephila pilipes TaxID=299642 RepID=A0A8X6MX90_NEPPI|nr:hypothetical protein NPIL_576731 [Nephila pilipes]
MITDQIKRRTPPEMYDHFIDEWTHFKKPDQIASKLDDYENVIASVNRRPRENFQREYSAFIKRPPWEEQKNLPVRRYIPPHSRENTRTPKKEEIKTSTKECYICGLQHLAKNCPKRYKATGVNGYIDRHKQDDQAVTAEIRTEFLLESINKKESSEPKLAMSDLQYVEVAVNGKCATALIDSGSMITVLNSDLISNENNEEGKIILKSAFGEKIEASLSSVQLWIKNKNNEAFSKPIQVLAAITDKIQGQAIIPLNIYQMLKENANETTSDESTSEIYGNCCGGQKSDFITTGRAESGKHILENEECLCLEILFPTQEENEYQHRVSERALLRDQQLKCDTLKAVWKQFNLKKGNFYLRDDLLFHDDRVTGEKVAQLVLPKIRRPQVLKLVHESVFGSHMGFKKTSERIRFNFWWPDLKKDILEYCKSCNNCQLRSQEKATDKIPITPVLRPDLPFEVVNVDIIGEIDPPSARKHEYCLVMIDQHSRWPEAIPLRSLSAKATCDALMEIFMRTGIPNVIASDMGTNFTSKLTQEFMKRLGCTPRFSVPGYAASNGLVEVQQSIKKFIAPRD